VRSDPDRDWLVAWVVRARHGLRRRSRNRASGGALLLLLVGAAVGILIVLNLAAGRELGLFGELAYAIVVVAVVLWALGQTGPVRRMLAHARVEPFSFKRSLLWSAFALIAVPVAWAQRPEGAVVLGAWLAFCLLLAWRRGTESTSRVRTPWFLGAGVGLLLAIGLSTIGPRIGEARDPAPAPPAVTDEPERDLAAAVRPLLRFDEVEKRFPIEIDEAMQLRRVRACRQAFLHDPCPAMTNREAIDLNADYYEFDDIQGPPGGGEESAYYYRVAPPRPNRMYVDFWWFFTDNPTPVARGTFCAPGFRLPGLTCHHHRGDWEGVTVVLGPCPDAGGACAAAADGSLWTPVAVRYAQHEFLVSYPWATLQELGARRGLRPLVFVARDSHASYPTPCPKDCRQLRRLLGVPVDEATHDGQVEWTWNGNCPDCLHPLPVTDAGEPAAWNAFEGRWGSQRCLLGGAYCDTSGAPKAPPLQHRYDEPWQAGPWLCLRGTVGSRRLARCERSASPDGRIPS
jgi:hypothetical protein